LDFLNSRVSGESESQIRFFGVEMSVVKIGNSIPAPQFTVVASPHGWNEQLAEIRAAVTGGGKAQAYRAFWAKYLVELDRQAPDTTKVRSAPASNWITINYLRKGVSLNLVFIGGGQIATELYIDLGNRTRNIDVFYALKDSQTEIENAIGAELFWDERLGRRACRIRISQPGDVLNIDQHSQMVDWFVKYQVKFKQTFRSLVEQLPSEIWDREIPDEGSSTDLETD
jgi:hypothetical protein